MHVDPTRPPLVPDERPGTWTTEHRAAEASVPRGLQRVYESSQQLLHRRADLLLAEMRVLAQSVLFGGLGAILSLAGVCWTSYGLFRALSVQLSPLAAAVSVGAVQLLAGLVLVAVAKRWLSAGGPRS